MYQAGTLSGNPLAMAAGIATLRLLDDGAYANLERLAKRLTQGLAEVFRGRGVPHSVASAGSPVADAGGFRTKNPPCRETFISGRAGSECFPAVKSLVATPDRRRCPAAARTLS